MEARLFLLQVVQQRQAHKHQSCDAARIKQEVHQQEEVLSEALLHNARAADTRVYTQPTSIDMHKDGGGQYPVVFFVLTVVVDQSEILLDVSHARGLGLEAQCNANLWSSATQTETSPQSRQMPKRMNRKILIPRQQD